jgi:sodium/hydrogen antiporter
VVSSFSRSWSWPTRLWRQFTETLGTSLSFLVWSLFGALFVGGLLTNDLFAKPIVYALLSLTVIRMLPVAIALIGTHLRPSTVVFMGWFGPRGLASVVFTLIALDEFENAGGGSMLVQTATWTILLSVVLHGISAPPLATRYGASIANAGKIPEKAPATEPAIRLHDLAGRRTESDTSTPNTPETKVG